ncbi:CehA/McbA family metallohydrolase domain-containing protein [Niabella aquatica]
MKATMVEQTKECIVKNKKVKLFECHKPARYEAHDTAATLALPRHIQNDDLGLLAGMQDKETVIHCRGAKRSASGLYLFRCGGIRSVFLVWLLHCCVYSVAQPPVDLKELKNNGARVTVNQHLITVKWPCGQSRFSKIVLNLQNQQALLSSIQEERSGRSVEIAKNLDPVFILRSGKRKLSPTSGGWDIFFDKVPNSPYQTHVVELSKSSASARTVGASTVIKINKLESPGFTGYLEITFYNGSPLFNIAAVVSTGKDSTAILYDAGLVNKKELWRHVAWSDVSNNIVRIAPSSNTNSANLEVKYRTVIGENASGSLAVFPAPHQYFYPLDEAFNLRFTWCGKDYLNRVPGFGIGIRQDPVGDKRFVPWFNAPPETLQRLNFFCLLSSKDAEGTLDEVKRFTNNDAFVALPGFKRMATHFHNEFIMNEVMSGKSIPSKPEFVDVLKKAGLDIVKLAEFHGVGHPTGPDSIRLVELKSLFEQTKRLSDSSFLLLPGEEANNFYGGHWLAFFPKPVYWIMSRKEQAPFETKDSQYGTVYRVGNKEEMLKLLEKEKGLAWVAHARTKASTGYPDQYKDEAFFKSDTYLGAAWKSIPADLSWPTLSQRVIKLVDDMANWGHRKHAIAESDIFTITHQNEMYAHLNVIYLKLDQLPLYEQGWQPVLDAMRNGKFFVSTGEVLIPVFKINGSESGDVLKVPTSGKVNIEAVLQWNFPMNFVEIVSGDGEKVYRERISLNHTTAFGKQQFSWPVDLSNKKWVRIEAWDIAANGAFTPMIWLE